MRCPFCTFDGMRREVHAHLLAEHRGQIAVQPEADDGPCLSVSCPACAAPVRVPFDARTRPAELREEVEAAANMVAFDLLLYHMEAEHPPAS